MGLTPVGAWLDGVSEVKYTAIAIGPERGGAGVDIWFHVKQRVDIVGPRARSVSRR